MSIGVRGEGSSRPGARLGEGRFALGKGNCAART